MYLKWKKSRYSQLEPLTTNLQCDRDSTSFHVSLQRPAVFCLSARSKLLTPPHSYSQLSDLQRSARRIKHDMQSGPEQGTRRGRERLTVSHQNIHHSAECRFRLAHGHKTLFIDTAPTRASGSHDR